MTLPYDAGALRSLRDTTYIECVPPCQPSPPQRPSPFAAAPRYILRGFHPLSSICSPCLPALNHGYRRWASFHKSECARRGLLLRLLLICCRTWRTLYGRTRRPLPMLCNCNDKLPNMARAIRSLLLRRPDHRVLQPPPLLPVSGLRLCRYLL